jgi:hypothetical protein
MAAAQRLATATSIDLAVAWSHSAMRTAAQAPVQRTIGIGAARKLHRESAVNPSDARLIAKPACQLY